MFVLGGNKSLGQDNWSTSQELAVSTSSPCSVSCNTDLIQHLPRLASHPWTPPVTSKKEEVRKNVLLPFTKKGFGIENLKIPLILFRSWYLLNFISFLLWKLPSECRVITVSCERWDKELSLATYGAVINQKCMNLQIHFVFCLREVTTRLILEFVYTSIMTWC